MKNKIIWRCTSKKGKCRARIHTLGNKVIYSKGPHNHPQRDPYLSRKQLKTKNINIPVNIKTCESNNILPLFNPYDKDALFRVPSNPQ